MPRMGAPAGPRHGRQAEREDQVGGHLDRHPRRQVLADPGRALLVPDGDRAHAAVAQELAQGPDRLGLGLSPGRHPDADDVDRPAQELRRPVAVAEPPGHDEVAAADDDGVLFPDRPAQGRAGRGLAADPEDGQRGRLGQVLPEDLQEQLVAVVARAVEADEARARRRGRADAAGPRAASR